jgi:hypothetical protein
MNETAAAIAFFLLALLLPGLGVQRWLRRGVDPALVLPLGTALAAGAYWFALASGRSWLFPVLLAACAAGALRRRPAGSPLEPSLPWRLLLPPALALVALLAATQYGGNRPAANGSFLLDPMGDQPLHAGITRELTLPYPPEVPGLAGVPLRYHFGADLVRAAALRWAGVTPYALLNRLEPTLWALGLLLALASLARRLGGTPLAAALAAWSLVACDLSFLVAPLRGAPWWSDVFRGNLLVSLAFANPVVPALTLALGALLALSRHEGGEGRSWLAIACVLGAAVPFFKVFLGAQLGLALGLAFLLQVRRLSPRTLAPMLLLALSGLPGVLWLAGGAGGEQVEVRLAPLRMIRDSLANLRFEPAAFGLLLALALPWLLVSLGLRVCGLGTAWRSLARGGPAAAASGALALSGWPLGLLLHAAARDIEGRELPSAAIYFVEQSGAVLWVFAALAVAGWSRGRRRYALLALTALGVLPSTIEFAVRKARVPMDPVPAAFVRAVAAVEHDARPGDRVLQRPSARYPPLPVVLASQRVLYERFTPYLTQFAPTTELRRRHELLFRFFRTEHREEAVAIARSLEARYLCLYGPDRIRFDASAVLAPVHEEEGARCYRFVGPAASGGSSAPQPGADGGTMR